MARSRNIKPGFFKNEQLADCQPLARLLFAGLWCLADREGRLEDRPKRIRAEVLPYDDGSVDDMLNELQKAGFILRYTHTGQAFIQVVNFNKHQNPHCKEQVSSIPAPDMHGASTVQEPEQHRTSPADSLNLIPDSLNPELPVSNDTGCAQAKPAHIPDCPHEKLINLYAKHLPELPQPRSWEGQRATNMRSRWKWVLTNKAKDENEGLKFFCRFFDYVKESDFLMGRTKNWNGCDLPWLVKAENFAKVIDGKYENRGEA